MSIFGSEIDAAADKMKKSKIKASEFEGDGLILQFLKVERIQSQFGADEDSTIVDKGILEEGEQFQFDFKDAEGINRRLWSTSMPFFLSMQSSELNENDWLHIQRSGKTNKDKKYTVTKVDAPVSQLNSDFSKDVPF
jgi:hypothetical protein